MKVETYEIEEVRQETEQQSAEAIALCEQLGLTGQLKKDSNLDTTVRCPYRLMTDEELFVYSRLCPEQQDVHTFANEPIPVEVLKTLAYAKSLGLFKIFEVWSASSVKVKDPILVAYPENRWGGKAHLLARWGDELLPLEVLLPDAIKKFWAERTDKLNDIIHECQQMLTKSIPSSHASCKMPTFYTP